jgi:hypothetical protein
VHACLGGAASAGPALTSRRAPPFELWQARHSTSLDASPTARAASRAAPQPQPWRPPTATCCPARTARTHPHRRRAARPTTARCTRSTCPRAPTATTRSSSPTCTSCACPTSRTTSRPRHTTPGTTSRYAPARKAHSGEAALTAASWAARGPSSSSASSTCARASSAGWSAPSSWTCA